MKPAFIDAHRIGDRLTAVLGPFSDPLDEADIARLEGLLRFALEGHIARGAAAMAARGSNGRAIRRHAARSRLQFEARRKVMLRELVAYLDQLPATAPPALH